MPINNKNKITRYLSIAATSLMACFLIYNIVAKVIPKAENPPFLLLLEFTIAVLGLLVFSISNITSIRYVWSLPAAKIVVAILTYIVVSASGIYADRFIAETTSIKPEEFDSARRTLTIAIAPLFWTIAFSCIALLLYVLQIASLLTSSFKNDNEKIIEQSAGAMSLIIFIVVLFQIPMKLYSTQEASEDLQRLLVFSSYIKNEDRCKNISPEKKIAFLKNELTSTYDGKSIKGFGLSRCDRNIAK